MKLKSFLKTLKVVAFLSVCLCIGFVFGTTIGYLIAEHLPLYGQLLVVVAMVLGFLTYLAKNIAQYKLKVKILGKSNHPLPEYATPGSAGMDIRANISGEWGSTETAVILPGQSMLISTGLYLELPAGYEAQVRPRSGLALKNGITVLNAPGTIDSSYRGEIGVILINHSTKPFTIANGDRIAQLVVAKHETVGWQRIWALTGSERGEGGFGHSGVK